MKRNLLLTFLSIFCFTIAFSQITHRDFDEGLVIQLNENYAMDIDLDGTIDFYINQHEEELGFSPIFAKGCFASPSELSYTSFNARELRIFDEGQVIRISNSNMYDYIDDDRGSMYHTSDGLAKNLVHLEEYYLGVAVFSNSGQALNGWMKVAVDTEANTLILKELAYQDFTHLGAGLIAAGDTGIVAVENLDKVLDQVVISPNPVVDLLQLSFDYSGEEQLKISILSTTGKLVSIQTANGSVNYTFDTADWTPGMYFVNFSTSNGVKSEKIFVTK